MDNNNEFKRNVNYSPDDTSGNSLSSQNNSIDSYGQEVQQSSSYENFGTTGGFGFGLGEAPTPDTTGGFGFGLGEAPAPDTTSGFGFGLGETPASDTTSGFGFGLDVEEKKEEPVGFGVGLGETPEPSTYSEPEQGIFSYGEAGPSTYGAPKEPQPNNNSNYEQPEQGIFSYGEAATSSYNEPASNEYSAPDQSAYSAPEQNSNNFNYAEPEPSNFNYGTNPYDTYNNAPVKENGAMLKNHFGMKLTFSIIEIFFATIWGILGLIFTCSANSAYNRGDWEAFRSKSKVATIMLWIGFAFSVLSVIAMVILVIAITMFSYDSPLGQYVNGAGSDYIEETYEPEVEEAPVEKDRSNMPPAQERDTFKLNGKKLEVPGDVSAYAKAFEKAGFHFEDDIKKTTVPANKDDYYSILNDQDYIIASVNVYNVTGEDIKLKDGIVGGITVYVDWDDSIQIKYLDGINNSSTKEDYIAVLGEPDYQGDDYEYLEWYTDEGWIEVNLSEGKLDTFKIYAYTSLQD